MVATNMIDDPTSDEQQTGSVPSAETTPLLTAAPPSPAHQVNWPEIVGRVQTNDQDALAELYQMFAKGIKFMIVRQLGRQDLEDRVHDTFVIVVQAIQRGDLREPERLMGFVRTIVRRQIAAFIERNYIRRRDEMDIDTSVRIADSRSTPEERAIQAQNAEMMQDVLLECSKRDREILTRFYLLEQSQETICAEMGLSETQFRLLKSRAKQRFSEEGRKRIAKNSLRTFFVRKRSGS